MARDIWVISDTHLFHENSLKFGDGKGGLMRPNFADVKAMNDFMLEQWNSVVKQGDIVYHLGDVFIGDKDEFAKLWPKFKGQKRLIVGNHDDIRFMSSGNFFQKVSESRTWSEFGLVFTHRPMHRSGLLKLKDRKKGVYGNPDDCYEMINCHGHIHHNDSPEGPYRNLSVEKINYTPVNIEELRIL
jgi:calcineurin-like phosphoesterase family protein